MEAVQIVGLEILRGLVLCIHAFKFYQDKNFKSISVSELWDHSLRTATAARKLARYENLSHELQDEAFVSGLLHDIGKLVLAANADADYQVVMDRSRREGTPVDQIEWEMFGATHAQIGAYLLGLWGLPEPVVSNVELHHSLDLNATSGFTPSAAIHIAQFLERSPNRISQLDTRFLKQSGVETRVSEWERVLHAED
jgi:putative nucleotidyltransferase with HDIG domain